MNEPYPFDFAEWFSTVFDDRLKAVEIPGVADPSWDRRAAYLLWMMEGSSDMAPRKGGRKPAVNDVAGKLQEAIKFLSLGHKASGNEQANHIWFQNGWGTAFDGVIAVATPIEGLDFTAYANTKLLIEALSHVGKEMTLTVDGVSIEVKSGDYFATVPLGNRDALVPTPPDAKAYPIDERFTAAMELASRMVSDSAENFRDATIYLKGDTVVATNGKAAIEAWHGNNMPPGLCFPKQFATALNKAGKKLAGFGFNAGETFTVHFEDGSYMRTQLYREQYPGEVLSQLETLMKAPLAAPIPEKLFEAIDAVLPFAPDGAICFDGGEVVTGLRADNLWSATVTVPTLPDGVCILGKPLLLYRDVAKTIWFGDRADQRLRLVFNGDAGGAMFRAVIGGSAPDKMERVNTPEPTQAPANPQMPVWSPPVVTGAPSAAPAQPSNPWPSPDGTTASPAQTPAPNAAPAPWQGNAPSPSSPVIATVERPPEEQPATWAPPPTPHPDAAPGQPNPTWAGNAPATTGAPVWAGAPGSETAPNAPVAPVGQAPATATQAAFNAPLPPFANHPITLPYTPLARQHPDYANHPMYATTPYTLAPGETLDQFGPPPGSGPNTANPTSQGSAFAPSAAHGQPNLASGTTYPTGIASPSNVEIYPPGVPTPADAAAIQQNSGPPPWK